MTRSFFLIMQGQLINATSGEERETIKLKQEKRKRTQIRTKADKTPRTLNECFYAKEVKTIFLPLQLYFKLQNNIWITKK